MVFAGVDGADYHQPVPTNFVGNEVVDPAGVPGCHTPEIPCRYSDAAFISYLTGGLSEHGVIARTEGPGSLKISSSTPRFFIQDAPLGFTPFGTVINKMGRTTG